jgi:Leucine-rich repeat (LRR) protein
MDVQSKSRRQLKGISMQERLKIEVQGKDIPTLKELNLDSCRDIQIESLSDEYKSLELLSLINVGLTTLRGFPKLINLKRLELSDNKLTGSLEYLLACPMLTSLNLSGNKIKDLSELEPLAKLTNLTNLDLFNCDITHIGDYRTKVFALLPTLKFLDGVDASGENEEDLLDEDCDDEEDESDEDEEDEDEEDEDEEEGDEDGEDDENEVGLSYLAKSNLKDDDDDENDGDFKEDEEMKE